MSVKIWSSTKLLHEENSIIQWVIRKHNNRIRGYKGTSSDNFAIGATNFFDNIFSINFHIMRLKQNKAGLAD